MAQTSRSQRIKGDSDLQAPLLSAGGGPSAWKEVSAVTEICVDANLQEVSTRLTLPQGETLLEALPSSGDPAIASTVEGEADLTFDELKAFLSGPGSFRSLEIGRGAVVAVVVENGPIMAVALLAAMAQACAAPIDPTIGESALAEAFDQLGVAHVLTLYRRSDKAVARAAAAVGASVHYLRSVGHVAGIFKIMRGEEDHATHFGEFVNVFNVKRRASEAPGQVTLENRWRGQPRKLGQLGQRWQGTQDTCLLLRTSGTTATPKVVPLTLGGLVAGANAIACGLELTRGDRCLNVMPLTHIGGISCSLLAPLLSGGSVVCTPGFDVASWESWLAAKPAPTWYYAVPTIHEAILVAAGGEAPQHSLRLIRSGAANLPHGKAEELSAVFGCPVYPTYSMSECMPIAQPPPGYRLEKPSAVGVPIAGSLRVAAAPGVGNSALPYGETGEVCISGPVLTPGYIASPEANAAEFFVDGGATWFRTGDLGHIDADGFVYLTGRSKELIKRGGDQVSPFEVEAALAKHAAVKAVVVFGVPNGFWGEEVAAAVVLT